MAPSTMSVLSFGLVLLSIAGSTTAYPLDPSAIAKGTATESSLVDHRVKGHRQNDYRPQARSNDAYGGSTLNELYADLMQATIEEKNKAALAHGSSDELHGVQVRRDDSHVEHTGAKSRATAQRRRSSRAPLRRSPVAGSTLNEQYAAMIQAAIEENDMLELDPENASDDLFEAVRRYRAEVKETLK